MRQRTPIKVQQMEDEDRQEADRYRFASAS